MPAHHTLEAYLDAYIEAAVIRNSGKVPLFRSAIGRTGMLTDKPMNRVDAWRMIQRRATDLGFRVKIGCHTFRATGITAYLEAGGTLENAQAMAAHESPRTTKLYVSIREHLESLESLVIRFWRDRFAGAAGCGRTRTVVGMTEASCATRAI
jgi:integrase